jgi:hypothetical protein
MEILLHPRMPQLLLLGSGALLIIAGFIMTAAQFTQQTARGTEPLPRVLKVDKSGFEVRTTYVGLILIAIGAALEALGAFLWRGTLN